jgi:hypothetical protein
VVFLKVTFTSQSILWLTEEKYVFEFNLLLLEYSQPKASPSEMTEEQVKINIKYVKRKIFTDFSFILENIVKLYYMKNTCASKLLYKIRINIIISILYAIMC